MRAALSPVAVPGAWKQRLARAGRCAASSQECLLLVASVIATLVFNGPFWAALLDGRRWGEPRTWSLASGTFLIVVSVHYLLFALPSTRHSIKPWLFVLTLCSAAASWYMTHYAVIFDAAMLRNVLHTEWPEASELVGPKLVLVLLLAAAGAALLLAKVQPAPRGWRRALLVRGGSLALALVAAMLGAALAAHDLSSLLRNRHELRYLVTPANVIVGAARVLGGDAAEAAHAREPVGADARLAVAGPGRLPRLLVLVVGETVRAQNWGLNGYARQTTPELAALDLINFADVTACGSSTEVSLPCMFSAVGRRDYDETRIRSQQSLLHVLARAGLDIAWIDNQTGCKGVCDGLAEERIAADADPALCDGRHCLDGILLQRLAEGLALPPRDGVLVLHPLGNHGPSYHHRYPPEFARFRPACASDDLGDCSRAEITNSYDNAVLYTDHLLAQMIGLLRAQTTRDVALLYVSDHGESLGEHGLYLHGVPWAIAPAEQTRVPMVLWLSDGMREHAHLDIACLRREAAAPHSHDHLFHSVLGLMGVGTAVHDAAWDLFAGFRTGPAGRAL